MCETRGVIEKKERTTHAGQRIPNSTGGGNVGLRDETTKTGQKRTFLSLSNATGRFSRENDGTETHVCTKAKRSENAGRESRRGNCRHGLESKLWTEKGRANWPFPGMTGHWISQFLQVQTVQNITDVSRCQHHSSPRTDTRQRS